MSSYPLPRHIDVGTALNSRYELLAPLGRGGMGLVFKAHDHTMGVVVALKILLPGVDLSPEIQKRFREEAILARKVRHRNVCAMYSYEEDGDVPFIVMELVEGTDLKRFLQKVGSIEWEDGFEVAVQVSEGLTAIHDVGVVHRDLKPANITRDDHGVVRVMDFGIARGGTQPGVTDDGKVVGTIDYMSPEQILGRDLDPRSDLYSFGVVIYELFTGRTPFKSDTPISTMHKHLHEPPPLHGVAADLIPTSLVPVLERSLAKDRTDRFSDAQEMRQALQAAREEMRKEGTDPVASPSERRPDGRPPRRAPVGPYPAEALLLVPTLVRALASPDRGVRVGAAEALTRTPAVSAREALTKASTDQDREVRERATEALRRLDAPSRDSPSPSDPAGSGPGFATSSAEAALVATSDIARVRAGDGASPDPGPIRPPVPSPPSPPVPPPRPQPPAPKPPPPVPHPAPRKRRDRTSALVWLGALALAGGSLAYVLLQWKPPGQESAPTTTAPPSPSSIATPAEPPPTVPSTPPPPTTTPPPSPTPTRSATPRPTTTTTTLAPATTTMPPPTPVPTPEPPPTTEPRTPPPTLPPTSPPPPPPPAPGALVEVGDPGVKRPVCVACPPPPLPLIAEDPRYAMTLRRSGSLVELRVLVDENGRVTDTRSLKGDKALTESAIKTVRLWKYTPAEKQGVRVKVWLIVPIQFMLPR